MLTRLGVGWSVLLLIGVCWALLGWRLGLDGALPAYLYLAAVGSLLAAVDWREQRLPDALLRPAYPVTAGLLVAAALLGADSGSLRGAAAGGAALWGLYLALRLIYPPGVGLGDVKLAGLLGIAAGWFGWDSWLVALAAPSLLAGPVVLLRLALGRTRLQARLAWGPYMLAGTLLAVLLG